MVSVGSGAASPYFRVIRFSWFLLLNPQRKILAAYLKAANVYGIMKMLR